MKSTALTRREAGYNLLNGNVRPDCAWRNRSATTYEFFLLPLRSSHSLATPRAIYPSPFGQTSAKQLCAEKDWIGFTRRFCTKAPSF